MLSEEFPAKFHCNMAPNTEVVEFNTVANKDNFCEDGWRRKFKKGKKHKDIFSLKSL